MTVWSYGCAAWLACCDEYAADVGPTPDEPDDEHGDAAKKIGTSA